MEKRVAFLYLLLLAMAAPAFCQVMEVQLKQGRIFGYSQETKIKGRHFYTFGNIPFAQPPVGDLRMQDPVPAGPWEGVRNGSVLSSFCPQNELINLLKGKLVIIGNEDCLYLNVFTPKPSKGSMLPVMVFIHGDGFFLGGANIFPPTPLMNKDIILVTMNYRLNLLGFLSTQDNIIPGNQGLKDMSLALRWIQENIEDLGGDPTRVTLFGGGTGAISAHYHMMVPSNEGLFQRVILQSGTVLSPGYLNMDPRETAAKVAKELKCPGLQNATSSNLDSEALLMCLKTVPADLLVMVSNAFLKWALLPLLFVPCVDGSYLPDHPARIIKEGRYLKVDMIGGVTRDQGALNTRPLFGKPGQVEDLMNRFSFIAPYSLYYTTEKNPLYLSKRAYYQYLGNLDITGENADALTELYGDRRFVAPLDEAAAYHSRDAADGKPFYMFELQHRGAATFGELYNLPFGNHWIAHGDDLQYIFDSISFYPELQRDDDILMGDIMVTMWTNFAATGNPTPNQDLGFRWAPINESCLKYLGLKPVPTMEANARTQRVEFWKNMPTEQNMILYPERFTASYIPGLNAADPCASV